MAERGEVTEASTLLSAAWDDMLAELELARRAIEDNEYFPPAASDRVLAEGYRYLAGFLHSAVERAFHEDPVFPAFRNALSVFNKATIDNPDAVYFYAPVDGRKHYRVTAPVPSHTHWRGGPRSESGVLAPQYLIFESASGPMAGDTGSLAELLPGTRSGFGTLDSTRLEVGEDGILELRLGPERPPGYVGNFICTRKPAASGDTDGGDRYADYVSGRQLFYDWQREEPLALSIVCEDSAGAQPPALTALDAAERLRRLGALVRGQMHFWLAFYDRVLNVHGSHEASDRDRYFMPVNAYNRPNSASSDTGGGMSTNIYAGGIFDLAPDEALYVEARYTGSPVYTGFHLGNLWGESPDYANHQSSLNHFQMYMGPEGLQRWVVAHRDPGIANWIDTTGLPRGFLSHRWAYADLPPESEWPVISARKIRFDEIDSVVPADMPRLSSAERREAIAIRQAHVQRRYRAF